jgi:hypothetical protein
MYLAIPCRDRAQFVKWLEANEERGHTDDQGRNAVTVLEAVNGAGATICYMPVVPVIMLESLAPRPGATPVEMANALKVLVQGTVMLAAANGSRELVFWGTDEATCGLAEHAGFEKVDMPLYRMRLP